MNVLRHSGYLPIDEVHRLVTVRILRVARRLGWFPSPEMAEILGIDANDRHKQANYNQAICRLNKLGRLERIPCGIGAEWQYRITAAGRAWYAEQIARNAL